MSNPTTDILTKPLEFHQSADFDYLLKEARLHLRDLAGKVWTDHNAHDPGITILEVLCFAIADLSYRTTFDIKDLLTGYKGGKDLPEDLLMADLALPNHPLTLQDLRKVLLDLKDPQKPTRLLLRNAWPMIVTETEAPLFLLGGESDPWRLSLKRKELVGGGQTVSQATGNSTVTPPKTPLTSSDGGVKTPVRPLNKKTPAAGKLAQKKSAQDAKAITKTNLASANQPGNVPVQAVGYTSSQPAGSASTVPLVGLGSQGSQSVTPLNPGSLPFTPANPGTLTPTPINPTSPTIFTPPGGALGWKFPDDALRLNGLYGIQLEFEEDRSQAEYYLSDLNQNYFRPQVTVQGKDLTLNVLMPYWDQIQWSFRNLGLNTVTPAFTERNQQGDPYFIAVDKLNYDDYFYDYYAEVQLGSYVLPAYINLDLATPLRSEIVYAGQSFGFEAKWLDWNELANGVKMDYTNVSYQVEGVDFVGVDEEDLVYDIRLTFDNQVPAPNNKQFPILLRIVFDSGQNLPLYFYVAIALQAKLPDLFQQRRELENAIRLELLDAQSDLYLHYQQKISQVFELVYGSNGVWEHLGDHRNLCEDFQSFSASRVQEIALFGKVLVAPGYNVNEVLGELYYQVDQFLHPLIQFHSLGEMADKGHGLKDIFNGPLLEHGFIEDDDLANLDRRSVIYTSDLVRVMMDVEGVEAIENFSISSYIDNRLMGRKVTNCLSLTYADVYRPRLSVAKSDMMVEVGMVVETPQDEQVLEWYHHKLDILKAGQLPEGVAVPLELPVGRGRNTELYRSIQYDFPQIYGIGPFGLPADAEAERKARAHQLKAFLLPFEQLLANYLKQISHLPELFTFNETVDTTYPHTPLYEVPDVQPLFRPFLQSGSTWAQFKSDLNNAYRTTLQENEDEATWLQRRNRFLDHLIGRFAEGFSGYAVQLFDQHKHLLDEPSPTQMALYEEKRREEMARLIGDKIAFGMDMAQVTSNRNQGFDYQDTDQPNRGWGSENISGYKRRLCRLLGIRDVSHRLIFEQVDPDNPTQKIDLEGMHVIEHILLRPRVDYEQFVPVPNLPLENQHDGTAHYVYAADQDPYSFRVTIILPKGAGRFKNLQFRKFTEQLIRSETPAHILPDIRWMSGSCGHNLELAYQGWLENAYKLSPWEFQQWHLNPALGKANISLQNAAFLSNRNWLIFAMQAPCAISIQALNLSQQALTPLNGLIKLPYGSQDIFSFNVSHLGGQMRVSEFKTPDNIWDTRFTTRTVASTVPVKDLTGEDNKGLIESLGGEGTYRIEFTVGAESVELNLLVEPALASPGIVLIDSQQSSLLNTGDTIEVLRSRLSEYRLRVQPAFGTLTFATEPGVWQSIPYRSNANQEWRLSDFERDFQNGVYQFRYAIGQSETMVTIKIIEEVLPPTNTTLTLKANDVPMLAMPVEIDPLAPGIVWNFDFVPIGGDISFYTVVNGQALLFATESVTQQNHQQPLEVGDLWNQKGNGLYRAIYTTANGSASVDFKLEAQGNSRWSYADDWVLIHYPKGVEVVASEKVYKLDFDPEGPEQPYAFRFKSSQGTLSLVQGEQLVIQFTGQELLLGRGDLPPGVYEAIYQPVNGEKEVKYLEVLGGERLPFEIKKVTELKEGVYRVEPVTMVEGVEKLVWRVDGRYRSKSNSPRLTFNFQEADEITLTLVIVKDKKEESFEVKYSRDEIANWGHES